MTPFLPPPFVGMVDGEDREWGGGALVVVVEAMGNRQMAMVDTFGVIEHPHVGAFS